MTQLDPQDEYWFRQWYGDWAQRTKVDSDPDDPLHFYDYRAAWKAKATPVWDEEDQRWHWPSEFKLEGHPRLILKGINTKTGQRVE